MIIYVVYMDVRCVDCDEWNLEWCLGDQGKNLVRESHVLVGSSAGDITRELARIYHMQTSATGLKDLCFNKFDILGDGVRCICMC